MKTTFSIGEMGKLNNISTQALRYYDKIGLLKPKKIDKNNNYRYYTIDQFEKLDTIKYLKFLGMSLTDIKNHLSIRDVKNILNMLENQKNITEMKIKQYDFIKNKIENKIKIIKDYFNLDKYDEINIKEMPKRKIASTNINNTLNSDDEFNSYLKELQNLFNKNHLLFTGDIGVIISVENLKNQVFHKYKEIYFFIEEEEIKHSKSVRILPKGKYACIYHKGSFNETYKSYKKILKYININNYEIIGDAVEISLIDISIVSNEEELLTEIQIPIK